MRLKTVIGGLILFGGLINILTCEAAMNAGFLEGNIFYSKDNFYAGDTVKICSVALNQTGGVLVGEASFFVDSRPVQKISFELGPQTIVKDICVDWVAQAGKHSISAEIISLKNKSTNQTYGKNEFNALIPGENKEISYKDSDGDGLNDNLDPCVSDKTNGCLTQKVAEAAKEKGVEVLNSSAIKQYEEPLKNALEVVQPTYEKVDGFLDITLESLEERRLKAEEEIKRIEEDHKRISGGAKPGEEAKAGASKSLFGEITSNPKSLLVDSLARDYLGHQFYLASISVGSFVLKNRIVFYLLLGMIVYRIILSIFRKKAFEESRD